jgi:glycosyltransferase involved in cell wall biosynthesis
MYKLVIFTLSILFLYLLIYLIYITYKKDITDYFTTDLITFVIPTIGRKTLPRTLESLKNLKNKNWKAIVIFDGIEPNIKDSDPRIKIVKLDKKTGKQGNNRRNSAGNVRNYSLEFIDTKWTGFVDDDDTLNDQYINKLKDHINNDVNIDVVIFRMRERNGKTILPKIGDKDFKINQVGISFCLKTNIYKQFNFIQSQTEDYDLLKRIKSNGKNIIISDYIGYNVLGN